MTLARRLRGLEELALADEAAKGRWAQWREVAGPLRARIGAALADASIEGAEVTADARYFNGLEGVTLTLPSATTEVVEAPEEGREPQPLLYLGAQLSLVPRYDGWIDVRMRVPALGLEGWPRETKPLATLSPADLATEQALDGVLARFVETVVQAHWSRGGEVDHG